MASGRSVGAAVADHEIFLDKYFPRKVKDDMVEKFLKLEQGEDETIKDYEARFARLPRFATYGIDTEERRATRFKNGLKYGIQKFLTAVTLDMYDQVLDKLREWRKRSRLGTIQNVYNKLCSPPLSNQNEGQTSKQSKRIKEEKSKADDGGHPELRRKDR
ncbi:hypothetical protein RJ639_041691 [Escallonia herrerae]|uniref:Retrotransposon gag domain-containing protein n=1 Tax=Escallonia herrerae TaxID=1293975 RepID=A0AA88WGN8_9ASTE|nr:hypothetical protein RJ639_041691 [Escallonia herrerae]